MGIKKKKSTCAKLIQVMTKMELQVGKLEGNAKRWDKPWGKTRVDSGTGGQGCWSYKLVTSALRTRFTCRAMRNK